jgi:hypothetical protein
MSMPATATRVQAQTPAPVNEEIRQSIETSVVRGATGDREWIERRLASLDREWDVERAVEAWFSGLGVVVLALGLSGRRGWLGLSLVMSGFLFNHALRGWCPPVSALRRLGFRTAKEIDEEPYALKVLRGDFEGVGARADGSPRETAACVLSAVRS